MFPFRFGLMYLIGGRYFSFDKVPTKLNEYRQQSNAAEIKGLNEKAFFPNRGRLLLRTPGHVPLWDLHVF